MLEWYRVGAGLWAFMDEVIEFSTIVRLGHSSSSSMAVHSSHKLLDPKLPPEQWFLDGLMK